MSGSYRMLIRNMRKMQMKLGISGTRDGMTSHQRAALIEYLHNNSWRISEFHHGDCIGVDDEAAELVAKHTSHAKTIVHPPLRGELRANNEFHDEIRPAKPYLDRNRDIVHESDEMVIIPKESEPQSKGGTWFTYRYAVSIGKKTLVIYPDGTTKEAKS